MKFSSVVRYIQKTKECRNSFLGILICHEIMFHVSMSDSVCRFFLSATELQVTYQLNGASLFFILPRSRCPPCLTASLHRPQSSRQWIPRRTPCWPARPAGLRLLFQTANLNASWDSCFSSFSQTRAAMVAAARARAAREGVPPREISVEHSSPSRSSG